MPQLSWRKKDTDGLFELDGDIAENSNLATLIAEMGTRATLDLASVRRVSSPGVREWLKFVQSVAGAGKAIELCRCSSSFVKQLNMITGFSGDARVRSVLAPYACPECTAVDDREIDLLSDIEAQREAPLKCRECGAPMVFDDLPEHYFAFLKPR